VIWCACRRKEFSLRLFTWRWRPLENWQMKLLPLVWAGLWRKPAVPSSRSSALLLTFLLFGLLQGIDARFPNLCSSGNSIASSSLRFGQPLRSPTKHRSPASRHCAPDAVTILLGSYQDPKNSLSSLRPTRMRGSRSAREVHVPKEQTEAVGRIAHRRAGERRLATSTAGRWGSLQCANPGAHAAGHGGLDFDVAGIMTDAKRQAMPDPAGEFRVLRRKPCRREKAPPTNSGQIDDPRHAAHLSRQSRSTLHHSGAQTQTQSSTRASSPRSRASATSVSSPGQLWGGVFHTTGSHRNTMMDRA